LAKHRVLAEELGDVVFVADRGVVLVHRERAEHIARALGDRPEAAVQDQAFALPARTSVPAPEAEPLPLTSRWRSACGWLGIAAGTMVFMATLVVHLDDPAFVVALMFAVRGGRMLLMEPQPDSDNDLRDRSKRLVDASRHLLSTARAHIETAQQRLDRARNTLQASWLVRALRERLRQRDS
jgi:hypothetical protein